MKVLLSWSGKQSNSVARFLRNWLPQVIPSCQVWMSSEDLVPGGRWFTDLMKELQEAHFCIICLTPENVRSNWLYFEAGAIAAKSLDSPVCGYLIGLTPSSLSGPLAQFQAADASQEGTWALLRSVNQQMETGAHNETLLRTSFDKHWPRLRKAIQSALLSYDPAALPHNEQVDTGSPRYKLSTEAQTVLIEASRDQHGTVLMTSTMDGLSVDTNNKGLCTEGDARSEAKWKAAVRELVYARLLEAIGQKGEVFEITADGYRVADELIARSETPNA